MTLDYAIAFLSHLNFKLGRQTGAEAIALKYKEAMEGAIKQLEILRILKKHTGEIANMEKGGLWIGIRLQGGSDDCEAIKKWLKEEEEEE